MTIKKSDLYSSLWSSCDELRGGMDASQYKDYILTLLFVKYVSDKYSGNSSSLIEIPEGGSFADAVALKGDKEIGDKINTIIGRLAKANGLEGVIDVADFNDEDKLGKGKEMQDRLSTLVTIFDALDFRSSRADGDDLLGDAYEYLMRHFATESGKSKGQFYTPAEVSRVLAKVVGVGSATRQDQTIYDPTCGSGSLLLKAADEATRGVTIYGQEKDVATWSLAKMNMILHGHETADLVRADTITSPGFVEQDGRLKTFDFAVANPPFSTKSWSNGINPLHDEFERFAYGVPPAKNGDYAFLLHVIKSLKSTGQAAVILPHGVLFRANAEATIRRNLLKRGLIKGIIGLPPNLFYGTGIPACIVVIDKEGAAGRKGVFLIDASRDFIKDGNKNRLRSQDLHKIVDTFNTQIEIDGYSRLVPLSEIASPANDYTLNIGRYIDSSEPEDIQDLDAHLHGGIPEHDLDLLDAYWKAFPSLREQLFEPGDRAGYSRSKVDAIDVQLTIEANAEFEAFKQLVADTLEDWYSNHRLTLLAMKDGTAPKSVIRDLSENLLEVFSDVPILDRYDVYERLMTYWADVMQDDVYLISAEGWVDAVKPRAPLDDKERKISETADLVIGTGKSAKKYKMDLLPPALVVARYFAAERAALVDLQIALDEASSDLAEYIEEHGVEGGLVEDVVNDKGKVTKAAITAQMKFLGRESDRADELTAVTQCGKLVDVEAAAKKAVKAAQHELDTATLAKYSALTEDEIKMLVVDDKWIASVGIAVESEVSRTSQALATRCEVLDRRYETTLPEMEHRIRDLEEHVRSTLDVMLGGQR